MTCWESQMSLVVAVPEVLGTAATDLAGLGSTLSAAHAAAAAQTTGVLAAAAPAPSPRLRPAGSVIYEHFGDVSLLVAPAVAVAVAIAAAIGWAVVSATVASSSWNCN
jgi:hypothetical protein